MVTPPRNNNESKTRATEIRWSAPHIKCEASACSNGITGNTACSCCPGQVHQIHNPQQKVVAALNDAYFSENSSLCLYGWK